MKLRCYKNSDIKKGTRVLVRVDANVPIKNGRVVPEGDFGRIKQSLPEIQNLLKHGAQVTLMTHLGDPGGRMIKDLSVAPIARYYGRLLGMKVKIGGNGPVTMLENLRFNAGEEKNDPRFARELARHGDVFVNNAFAVCHREHASVSAITKLLPSFAGELLVREVTELSRSPKQPLVLVMGGVKLSTKLPLLERLLPQAQAALIGGGLAVTFLAATQKSLQLAGGEVSAAERRSAIQIMECFGNKLLLPKDFVVRSSLRKIQVITANELHGRQTILDIGPAAMRRFSSVLDQAKSVIWNGPMGVVEDRVARRGTVELARAIGRIKSARTVIGGGDTISFLERQKLIDGFSFVSTGGGAMLAFLGGESMPGIKPLVIK